MDDEYSPLLTVGKMEPVINVTLAMPENVHEPAQPS